jgi:hypothetical protein
MINLPGFFACNQLTEYQKLLVECRFTTIHQILVFLLLNDHFFVKTCYPR